MRKVLLSVLTVILAMSGILVHANTIPEIQQERERIRNEMREQRGELEGTRQEMYTVEYELNELDERLTLAAEELAETEGLLEDTNSEREYTEIELEEARLHFEEEFERFTTRLRVMYVQGSMGYLQVVLEANSFSDFLTRLDHMNRIARSDREMVDRLEEAEQTIEDTLEELHRQITRIEALQAVQSTQIEQLEDAMTLRTAFFERLGADARQMEAAIARYEQSERDLTAQIQRLQAEEAERRRRAQMANVVRPTGGSFAWPVPGRYRVSSPYGNRNHPILRRSEFHTGVDIPAPTGTNIVAAAAGTVILSGWNGGFGNTVVIDHGNGYTTLYGHNSQNTVRVGQFVNRGEVIARVGSTGMSTGPHLHFEVRVNGRHTSPNGYLGI